MRAAIAVVGLCGLWVMIAPGRSVRAGGTAILWKTNDIKWSDIAETPGARNAVLWGDPETGAYAAMNSWDAMVKGPKQARRLDIHFVVLAGTFIIEIEGQPARELVGGSYAMVPGGTRYTTTSGNQGETLFYSHQPGVADVLTAQPENK